MTRLFEQCFDCNRLTYRVTLNIIDIRLAQLVEHRIRLDKFSDHFHIEAVSYLGHRAHENITLFVLDNVTHEFAINFQKVDWELLEVTERG